MNPEEQQQSMNEERYNNRQLERFFDEQSKDLKEYFDATINPLTEQVTKTNGRVRSLEAYRNILVGFCTCMMIVVVPALGFIVLHVIQNSENIAQIQASLNK